jgi:hypothetical protein
MIVTMIALRPMKPPATDQTQTSPLVALKDCHVGTQVDPGGFPMASNLSGSQK